MKVKLTIKTFEKTSQVVKTGFEMLFWKTRPFKQVGVVILRKKKRLL